MLKDTALEHTSPARSPDTDESQSINITIFDVVYRLEILKVLEILDAVKIQKYMSETKSGFVRYKNKSILTFDMRRKSANKSKDKVTVLVIEALRNNTVMPIGFIIDTFEDFYNRLN